MKSSTGLSRRSRAYLRGKLKAKIQRQSSGGMAFEQGCRQDSLCSAQIGKDEDYSFSQPFSYREPLLHPFRPQLSDSCSLGRSCPPSHSPTIVATPSSDAPGQTAQHCRPSPHHFSPNLSSFPPTGETYTRSLSRLPPVDYTRAASSPPDSFSSTNSLSVNSSSPLSMKWADAVSPLPSSPITPDDEPTSSSAMHAGAPSTSASLDNLESHQFDLLVASTSPAAACPPDSTYTEVSPYKPLQAPGLPQSSPVNLTSVNSSPSSGCVVEGFHVTPLSNAEVSGRERRAGAVDTLAPRDSHREDVITRLAATALGMELKQHEIGCHLVQVLDLVQDLVDLDKQKQELTSEFWSKGLDLHAQLHLSHILRSRKMASQRSYPRSPITPSLHLYSDEQLKKIGRDFSIDPASLSSALKERWQS